MTGGGGLMSSSLQSVFICLQTVSVYKFGLPVMCCGVSWVLCSFLLQEPTEVNEPWVFLINNMLFPIA